jgi:hypothetical protein
VVAGHLHLDDDVAATQEAPGGQRGGEVEGLQDDEDTIEAKLGEAEVHAWTEGDGAVEEGGKLLGKDVLTRCAGRLGWA